MQQKNMITRRRHWWRQSIISFDFKKRTYTMNWWDIPMFELAPHDDDLVGNPIMSKDAPSDSNENRWGALAFRAGHPDGAQRFRGENFRSAQEWLPMVVPLGFEQSAGGLNMTLFKWPESPFYNPAFWCPMKAMIDPRDYDPTPAAFATALFRPASAFDPAAFRPATQSTGRKNTAEHTAMDIFD